MRDPDDPMSQAGWGRRKEHRDLSERDPAFGDTGPGSPGGGAGWGFMFAAVLSSAFGLAGGFEVLGFTDEAAGGFARLCYAMVIVAGLWMAVGAPRPTAASQLSGLLLLTLAVVLLFTTTTNGTFVE